MKKTTHTLNTLILLISLLIINGCNTSTSTNDLMNVSKDFLGKINIPTFGQAATTALSQQDISTAFKQALNIGTDNVVQQLGATNGFNLDPRVHIPLPSSLAKVQGVLETAGLSFMLDDLETRLNRAAEIATPHAKELFMNSISEMSFDDVIQIYNGPQDSATAFFRSKMSSPLAAKMQPFVQNAINQAGVINAYDKVMDQYKNIPFMPDVKSDLTSYVVDEGIGGIFYYLAEQEKQIRQDPVKQTTDLLKKVFGAPYKKN